jgi:hypothetical protein
MFELIVENFLLSLENFTLNKNIVFNVLSKFMKKEINVTSKKQLEKLYYVVVYHENFILDYCRENEHLFMKWQIGLDYRQEFSINGYSLDILKSAVQKYIRRGEAERAIYFCNELLLFRYFTIKNFNYEENKGYYRYSKGILTNTIHRLLVTLLEDISILNGYDFYVMVYKKFKIILSIIEMIDDDYSNINFYMKLLIRHTLEYIVMLCKSRKSRIGDHLGYYYRTIGKRGLFLLKHMNGVEINIKNTPLKLFDCEQCVAQKCVIMYNYILKRDIRCVAYAFDILREFSLAFPDKRKIVKRGNSREYDNLVFYIIDIAISHMLFTPKILDKVKYILKISVLYFNILKKQKESWLSWVMLLLYVINFENCNNVTNKVYSEANVDYENILYLNLSGKKKTVDDYIIDRHTYQGKVNGKNMRDFVIEGSKVNNEIVSDVLLDFKDKYNKIFLRK